MRCCVWSMWQVVSKEHSVLLLLLLLSGREGGYLGSHDPGLLNRCWEGCGGGLQGAQCVYEGRPQNPEFMYKKFVLILTCLNFSCLRSTLHLMQYTYGDIFSYGLKQFLNSSISMPFSFSTIFCFTSSTSTNVSLWGLFYSMKYKQSYWRWDQVNREGGAWGSCHFWSKTAEHSVRCGQVHL